MHILVTGGAGFIGSHLVRWLVEQGHTVRVLDNLSTGQRERLDLSGVAVELIEGDICDGATVQAATSTIDMVFHLAALVSVVQSVEQPLLAQMTNATGSLHVLEAARQAGVRRVVLMSSSAIYGNNERLPITESEPPEPLSPYAVTKLAAEQSAQLYTHIYHLETVSLRGFNIYGPGQDPASPYAAVIPRFVAALRSGTPPTIYGDGQQSRDFVFVADVVRALWAAATTPGIAGRVFNVGGGNGTTILELATMLRELLGVDIQPRFEPPRPGEVRHSCADVSHFKQNAGWQPLVSLREGLQAIVQDDQA